MPALSASYTHKPAADTAAVVTLAAQTGSDWSIRQIEWSYSAAPTDGLLTITDGGVVVKSYYITAAGPGYIAFPGGADAATNSAVVVTLSAGGASVSGALNVTLS